MSDTSTDDHVHVGPASEPVPGCVSEDMTGQPPRRPSPPVRRRLRVLALPAFRRRAMNPFQALLYDEAGAFDVDVEDWTFARALSRRVDVWHLHHPDTVVFPRSVLQSAAETLLMRGLLSLAKWRGTRIVWTVHDLDSSDDVHPWLERRFWGYFLPRVDACVYLSEAGRELARERFPSLAGVPAFVVPHGDFRPAYPNTLSREAARAALDLPPDAPVLLSFGLIRPYKDVPRLVDAVRELGEREVILLIAGRVWDADVERDIRARAGAATNVRLHLHWIAFEDTQRYFNACDLIVLPYRRILNSGTAMLALAFARPVLVPDRGTMSDLRERFGEDWVRLHDDPLDADALRDAVRWAARPRHTPPDLRGLDWATLAGRTRAVYDAVLDPGGAADHAIAPPAAAAPRLPPP